MEFLLSPKQQLVRRTLREFAASKLAPIAHDLDQQARRIRAMLAEYDVDALVDPVIELAEQRMGAS